MELMEAFQLLESRLPPGDMEVRVAFDKVRRRILSSVSAEKVAELEAKSNALGAAIRLIADYISNPTQSNKEKSNRSGLMTGFA